MDCVTSSKPGKIDLTITNGNGATFTRTIDSRWLYPKIRGLADVAGKSVQGKMTGCELKSGGLANATVVVRGVTNNVVLN